MEQKPNNSKPLTGQQNDAKQQRAFRKMALLQQAVQQCK